MVTIASNRFMAPVTEGYMKYFFQTGKENGRQICGFIAPKD